MPLKDIEPQQPENYEHYARVTVGWIVALVVTFAADYLFMNVDPINAILFALGTTEALGAGHGVLKMFQTMNDTQETPPRRDIP